MPRSFRVPEGRIVVLPQGVQAGPGATNMRLPSGSIVTLEDDTFNKNQRYLNGRVRAGDLVELEAADAEQLAKDGPPPELLPNRNPDKPMLNPTVPATKKER